MAYQSIVENQRNCFKSGKTVQLDFRLSQLKALKRMLTKHSDELSDAIYKDLRRSKPQGYCFEVANVIVEINYMIENLHVWTQPKRVEKTLLQLFDTPMTICQPLGVVLIIAPWNYPISMCFLPLVPALAAGNTVILKPSELAPNCANLVSELIADYFDKDILTVVQGGVEETSDLLRERFDHILYTGSPSVGRVIMQAAAKHLTPVTLEMGGKCPVFVDTGADVGLTAKRLAWGKWLNCGQTCLAPDYILTSSDIKPKLVWALRQSIRDFYGTRPQNHPDYSRIINQRHFHRLANLLNQTEGAILEGGQKDPEDCYIAPTIIDVKYNDVFMRDEIFGPILPILTVQNVDEAIDLINNGEKPLAAYIFTRNSERLDRFIEKTYSGGVTVNDVILHITVDTLPFGGVGQSGMGRYRGKFGFDTFSHEKSVLKRRFFGEIFLGSRYPPFDDSKFSQLKLMTGGRYAIPKCLRTLCRVVPLWLLGILIGILLQRYYLNRD